MPISIDVPDIPWSTQRVGIQGFQYTFKFKYNSRDERMYMDIALDEEVVINGIKLIEGNNGLLSKYLLESFDHGDLFCMKITGDDPITMGNIGLGKQYELVYFSNRELGV